MKTLYCALLSIIAGTAPLAAQHPATRPPSKPADLAEAVKGSNAFAVELYRRLSKQPGNLFFSPESISTAFAMAYAGASGFTATEIQSAFHFTLPPQRLHSAMGALLAGMNAPHKGYELHVAGALWAQQDAKILPTYLKLIQTDYGADFHQVDFISAPETARATINQSVENQTNGKIQNLLGPDAVTPLTRLILTNAIYFKGNWTASFDKAETQDHEFHQSLAQTEKAPLMHRTGSYCYFDSGTFQALELPYGGNELSMVVLLPRQIEGLPALEESFTAAAVKEWMQKLDPVNEVIVTLPRFKMSQQFELSGILGKMGMKRVFGRAADFSGIDGRPGFGISAAIHKAFIGVNEEGTEAAAATAIVMRSTSARVPMPEPPPIVFTADHPFLFLIRDNASGAILFIGRVIDPTK